MEFFFASRALYKSETHYLFYLPLGLSRSFLVHSTVVTHAFSPLVIHAMWWSWRFTALLAWDQNAVNHYLWIISTARQQSYVPEQVSTLTTCCKPTCCIPNRMCVYMSGLMWSLPAVWSYLLCIPDRCLPTCLTGCTPTYLHTGSINGDLCFPMLMPAVSVVEFIPHLIFSLPVRKKKSGEA